MYQTDMYEGMLAETVTMAGANGDRIHAYLARPLGPGPYPAVVLAHHMPGWDEWYREATRKFAHHGYVAISPDLYCRAGHAAPDDVTAKVRAEGGVPDDQAVGDLAGGARLSARPALCQRQDRALWHLLRRSTRLSDRVPRVGLCRLSRPLGWARRHERRPTHAQVSPSRRWTTPPISYCPLLGLFGEDDQSPSPEQVATHEAELKRLGKDYEFHSLPRRGAWLLLLRPLRLSPGRGRRWLEESLCLPGKTPGRINICHPAAIREGLSG